MPTSKDLTEEVQAQILATVRKSQDAVVAAVQNWTEAVQRLVPQTPAYPLAETLPKPAELVDSAFDFAEQLLAAQREFAHSILGITAATVDQAKEQAKEQAKPAAAKSPRGGE
ncbi:MAG TPA: hypothetical protein VIV12_30445 [Streptosporangiaceae bacterium]